MNTSPLVTIALPLYNAEEWIEACLLSALGQTYTNIEVLVADDCSTDGGVAVVEHLIATHSRGNCIRLLRHTVNSGCAVARNTIIDNAQGEYLFFLDSDDVITPDCIEHLVGIAVQHGDEMVIGSYTERNLMTGKNVDYTYADAHREGEGCLCIYKYNEVNSQPLAVALWNTLYSMNLLRRTAVRMQPFKAGSDNIFNKELLPQVCSFSTSSHITYIYIVRQNSIMMHYEEHIDAAKFTVRQRFREEERRLIAQCASQPYASAMARQNISAAFYAAKAMVRNRRKFMPSFPYDTFGSMLSHPFTLTQILRLPSMSDRLFHLAAWNFCHFPARVKYLLLRL